MAGTSHATFDHAFGVVAARVRRRVLFGSGPFELQRAVLVSLLFSYRYLGFNLNGRGIAVLLTVERWR